MKKLIYPEESYAIMGACFNVYKDKGCGYTEPIYQVCTEIELEYQAIPSHAQKRMKLTYRGKELRHTFKPDFICYDKIVVELKAVSQIIDEYRAQVLNYLNATGYQLGLLVNFGHYPKVEYERIILTDEYK